MNNYVFLPLLLQPVWVFQILKGSKSDPERGPQVWSTSGLHKLREAASEKMTRVSAVGSSSGRLSSICLHFLHHSLPPAPAKELVFAVQLFNPHKKTGVVSLLSIQAFRISAAQPRSVRSRSRWGAATAAKSDPLGKTPFSEPEIIFSTQLVEDAHF